MIGAIIGDIVGSRFEFNNHKSKDFELFADGCRPTDDTVMTLAVAKSLMVTEHIKETADNLEGDYGGAQTLLKNVSVTYMQNFGQRYPDSGYGGLFFRWIFDELPRPYNSFGNGAAMRISPVGYVAQTADEVTVMSQIVTGVSHNHPEGLKGAEAVAMAVFLARRGLSKEALREKLRNYYPLDKTIDTIRQTYEPSTACQNSVPQALTAFLDSTSFEDAIRNAVSIGGDSDTLAAITGSVAEAFYGVPEDLQATALSYLDDALSATVAEWNTFMVNRLHNEAAGQNE
ncbi:ADP-ribosylglycohydrolase family protein [Oscillospiraceae bacterium CM]|nr:ADP-ribosylglycohydrolase family protein [Oscillospiraceae bacterium CM]